MKKIYLFLSCAALALPMMAAEPQLPNNGFEGEWVKCKPYTSLEPQVDPGEELPESALYIGQTPTDWTIANVIGLAGIGATEVGAKAEGYESVSAVRLANTANVIMDTQIVPGYMTLGTSWNTSIFGSENDGGSFGGAEFTGRPEKITFMYKYERDSVENTEPATAVAYLWKGTTVQDSVPAGIGFMPGTVPTVEMKNRDRNILGMETFKGGKVTKSEDFELIAKAELKITETTNKEWVKGELTFEYFSDATPEMINVIFSANDYFKETVVKGNALTVDNVECVYAAAPATDAITVKASELEIPGTTEINGYTFTIDKAEGATAPVLNTNVESTLRVYANNTVTIAGPAFSKVVFTLNTTTGARRYTTFTPSTGALNPTQAEGDATITWEGDAESVTFTVGNDAVFGSDGASKRGQVHITEITIYPAADAPVAETEKYSGKLIVDMMGTVLTDPEGDDATITITPTSATTCDFLLPNLKIGENMVIGDIAVKDVAMTVADGTTTYAAVVENMQLLGGEIVADVKVNGTSTADGKISMVIDVDWSGAVITCTFNGVKDGTTGIIGITTDVNAPVEYYNLNGIRVNENAVAPGLYIRRQGNKATKVIIR